MYVEKNDTSTVLLRNFYTLQKMISFKFGTLNADLNVLFETFFHVNSIKGINGENYGGFPQR